MIIRFAVENYRSFKDREEMLLTSSKIRRHNEHVFVTNDGLGLLRSAAIYGGNGAGKTNFISAIDDLKNIVVEGKKYTRRLNNTHFKLNGEYLDKPTVFEIEFLINSKKYYYELSFRNAFIYFERLSLVDMTGVKKALFKREYNYESDKIELEFTREKSENDTIYNQRVELYLRFLKYQPYVTFLSLAVEFGFTNLVDPYEWFEGRLRTIGFNHNHNDLAYVFYNNKRFLDLANQIIPDTNVGIVKIDIDSWDLDKFLGKEEETFKSKIKREIEEEGVYNLERNDITYNIFKDNKDKTNYKVAKVITYHEDDFESLIPFDLKEESDGTQTLLSLIPALIDTLLENRIYIVDEIESSLHPVLLRNVLNSYLEMGQEYEGQLIFTTHESNLLDLDLFRQDEIWMTEKDGYGASRIYSLNSFNVRFDKNVRKDYLQGRYGLIPFIPKHNLLEKVDADEKG